MPAFSPAVRAMVTARVRMIPTTISGTGVPAVTGKIAKPPTAVGAISANAMSDPIMKTSPWAKLMSSMMP